MVREEIDIQLCFVSRKILTRMQSEEAINTNTSNSFKASIFCLFTTRTPRCEKDIYFCTQQSL